jgi:hypothetical protein
MSHHRKSSSIRVRKDSLKTPPIPSSLTTSVGRNEVHGAFTPTAPAGHSLQCFADIRFVDDEDGWYYVYSTDATSDISSVTSTPPPTIRSSLRRTHHAPPIPSISRTYSDSSDSPTATLVGDSPRLKNQTIQLDPVFASLERNSKFCRSSMGCATCGKAGSDFPRCGKCGDMWCSRTCRLNGKARHQCKNMA